MTKTRTDNPIPLPPIPFTDGEYRWKVRVTHIQGFYELILQRKRKRLPLWDEVASNYFNFGSNKRWSADDGPEVADAIIRNITIRRANPRPAIAGVYQP